MTEKEETNCTDADHSTSSHHLCPFYFFIITVAICLGRDRSAVVTSSFSAPVSLFLALFYTQNCAHFVPLCMLSGKHRPQINDSRCFECFWTTSWSSSALSYLCLNANDFGKWLPSTFIGAQLDNSMGNQMRHCSKRTVMMLMVAIRGNGPYI